VSSSGAVETHVGKGTVDSLAQVEDARMDGSIRWTVKVSTETAAVVRSDLTQRGLQ